MSKEKQLQTLLLLTEYLCHPNCAMETTLPENAVFAVLHPDLVSFQLV